MRNKTITPISKKVILSFGIFRSSQERFSFLDVADDSQMLKFLDSLDYDIHRGESIPTQRLGRERRRAAKTLVPNRDHWRGALGLRLGAVNRLADGLGHSLL